MSPSSPVARTTGSDASGGEGRGLAPCDGPAAIVAPSARILFAALAVALLFTPGCRNQHDAVLEMWPQQERATVHCIVTAESGWDAAQITPDGPTTDWGLFQLRKATWEKVWLRMMGRPWADSLNAYWNSKFARDVVYPERGWGSWSTARKCGV